MSATHAHRTLRRRDTVVKLGAAARHLSSAAAGAAREPNDLHAAWASLAAYERSAAGPFINSEAAKAKAALNTAGFELVREFVVSNGTDMSLDGTTEVEAFDAAHLWLREADGRSILAFRGGACAARAWLPLAHAAPAQG